MATQELTNVIVRPAVDADIPRLIVFIRPFVEDRKLLPRTYEELNELLAHFFIAEMDGRIVGCAALEIYSWKLAEIRSLAVAPDTQGMGIGKKLVEACLDRAHQKRVLEVMAITSSDRFFLNCGFDYTLPGEKRALFYQTRDL
ncbi:MAG: GNAT family N-acetyltransferase [Anaerolineae bacterium]|nr:GNAT family N-acetyltransferase [Anaerolineae bacterium]MBL8164818.1 GNAT family N-acetyltransferase [Anaerolineae bacterium]